MRRNKALSFRHTGEKIYGYFLYKTDSYKDCHVDVVWQGLPRGRGVKSYLWHFKHLLVSSPAIYSYSFLACYLAVLSLSTVSQLSSMVGLLLSPLVPSPNGPDCFSIWNQKMPVKGWATSQLDYCQSCLLLIEYFYFEQFCRDNVFLITSHSRCTPSPPETQQILKAHLSLSPIIALAPTALSWHIQLNSSTCTSLLLFMKLYNLGITILFLLCQTSSGISFIHLLKSVSFRESLFIRSLSMKRQLPFCLNQVLGFSTAGLWHLQLRHPPKPLSSSLNPVCWRISKEQFFSPTFKQIYSRKLFFQTWHNTGIQASGRMKYTLLLRLN